MWVRPRSRSSAIPSRNSGVAVWSAWFRKPAFSWEALRGGPGFPPPAQAAQPPQVPVAGPVGGQGGRGSASALNRGLERERGTVRTSG